MELGALPSGVDQSLSADQSVTPGVPSPARLLLLPRGARTRRELEESLRQSRAEGGSQFPGGTLLELTLWHAGEGHWGEALSLAEEGREISSRERKWNNHQAAFLLLMGSLQYRRGRWPEAQAAWRRIDKIGSSETIWRAASLVGLARLALRRGEARETEELSRESTGLADHSHEYALTTLSLITRSLLEAAREDWVSSEYYRHGARSSIEKTPPELQRNLRWELELAHIEVLLLRSDDQEALSRANELCRSEDDRLSWYDRLRPGALAAAALRFTGSPAANRPASEWLELAQKRGMGRLLPWFLLHSAGDGGREDSRTADLEERQEKLLRAHRLFTERGEKSGEFLTAIELARTKIAWGACRGAADWRLRAEGIARSGGIPSRWRGVLASLNDELDRGLSRRLSDHRRTIELLLRREASGGRNEQHTAQEIDALLESFRSRLNARRASLVRLSPPDRVELLAARGGCWTRAELTGMVERLPSEHLSLLVKGETLVTYSSIRGNGPWGRSSSGDGGLILLPLRGDESGVMVLLFDGSGNGEVYLPGTEELMLAGLASAALKGVLAEATFPLFTHLEDGDRPVNFGRLLTRSRQLKEILLTLNRVADSDVPVLIEGETGTGKELLARSLHEKGNWSGKFVAQNCAALPETLLEAELFGHAEGAFTGATRGRVGLIESAYDGTFLFDEVGEITLTTQTKLLRVLESGEVRRLGENEARPVKVRTVAATNRDLWQEVNEGRFRRDLYYRLHVVGVTIPPLRERREDIPILAEHFLSQATAAEGKEITGFTHEAMDRLLNHHWPGNVRELENQVRRAVALSLPDRPISVDCFCFAGDDCPEGVPDLKIDLRRLERERILEALARAGGNKSKAARLLGGMSRTTLLSKMKRLRITPP